jgi:hypothetical protein
MLHSCAPPTETLLSAHVVIREGEGEITSQKYAREPRGRGLCAWETKIIWDNQLLLPGSRGCQSEHRVPTEEQALAEKATLVKVGDWRLEVGGWRLEVGGGKGRIKMQGGM